MPPEEFDAVNHVALAITTDEQVVVDLNDTRRSFAQGEQRAFYDYIGGDTRCICDDVPSLVRFFSGGHPPVADPIWKMLDGCRLIDIRAAHRAGNRSKALCPTVPSISKMGTADLRLKDLRQEISANASICIPIDASDEVARKFGPLGAGHDTRVAVAYALAAGQSLDSMGSSGRLIPAAPDPDRPQKAKPFVAEHFEKLMDDWQEPLPRPLDENGEYSLDARDWGLAGAADERLREARVAWALKRFLKNSEIEDAGRRTRDADRYVAGRSPVDYGALRSASVSFRAPAGASLLRVQLKEARLRCYACLGIRLGWFPEVYLHEALRRGRDVPAAFVRELAQRNLSPDAIPFGYAKLADPDRRVFIRRLVEALIGRLGEDAASDYIAAGSSRSEISARERRDLVRQIRWQLFDLGWYGLNAYSSTDVIQSIARIIMPATETWFSLTRALETAYAETNPDGDPTHWHQWVAETFLGRHAGLVAPQGFWQILLEHCSNDESRREVKRARKDCHYASEIFSQRPVGLTGRAGPPLPVWQVRPVEVEYALEEVRGMIAYALVRLGLPIAASDGDDFLCILSTTSVQTAEARAKIAERAHKACAAAIGSLFNATWAQALFRHGFDIEFVDEW